MMKLILIFRSLLWPQAFLLRRTYFFQIKQQFTYLLNIIQWETCWNKIFFKKELCMSYVVFLYKSGPMERKSMDAGLIM